MPNSRRADQLVTVVTGGGSGFGEEICHTFAREGARIVVADLHAENGNRVVQARGMKRSFAVWTFPSRPKWPVWWRRRWSDSVGLM